MIYREPSWYKLVPPTILALWIYLHDIFPFEFVLYTIGDHCMIYVNNLSKDLKFLALSIFFFSLAHLFPIFSAIINININTIVDFPVWFICLWAVYTLFIIVISFIDLKSDLKYIISGYAFILTLRLSTSILFLSMYDVLAALLFCISDILIIVNMLFFHNKNIGSLILITYWLSLICRTLSIIPYQC